MKRWLVLLPTLLLLGLPTGAGAQPIRDAHGASLSCPDSSVLDAHAGRYRYYLVCTSDFAAGAFPIRGSNDLLHWHLISYVFPAGRQPWWALHSPQGPYWAPSLYRIGGRWVVYFATHFNAATIKLRYPDGDPLQAGQFVVGAATASSLDGPWHTKLLHYRGQFNDGSPEQESYGGVIDPSMVQDPRTGQRYLFWAEQRSSIWVSQLSADGLDLDRHIHMALSVRQGWECRGGCVVEGPAAYYRDGRFYLLYSGASTWKGTYAVGAAVAADPMTQRFKRVSDRPILQSGHRWVGPGGCSAPVTGPDGKSYLFYHAERGPNPGHVSAERFLMLNPIIWSGVGGDYPLINGGLAG